MATRTTETTAGGFTAEERAAMKERAAELRAEGKKGAKTIRKKTGRLVASFPVEESDQIMLVTDRGQLIRTRVEGIRIVSRSSQGVIVFDTAEDERVVSVERLSEDGEDVSNGS